MRASKERRITMKKPYMALRILMTIMDWDQVTVGEIIGRSGRYVQDRLSGKYEWAVKDAYTILKAANKPDSDFQKYFPRNPMEFVER